MRALIAAVAVLAFTLSSAEPRSNASGVRPSVAFLVTGGAWQTKTEHGRYRVVVEDGGWEHVTSHVFVEWLVEDGNKRRIVVGAAALISELGDKWSVGQPKVTPSKMGATVELPAANAFEPDKPMRKFFVELGAPGQYQVK